MRETVYQRYNLPTKIKTENSIFSLICQLEKELEKIVDGNDNFLLTVMATRKILKTLKKFF